ncbi:MAG: hypothetical protein WB770_05995, partial [Acidimicrobiales bacterium]
CCNTVSGTCYAGSNTSETAACESLPNGTLSQIDIAGVNDGTTFSGHLELLDGGNYSNQPANGTTWGSHGYGLVDWSGFVCNSDVYTILWYHDTSNGQYYNEGQAAFYLQCLAPTEGLSGGYQVSPVN